MFLISVLVAADSCCQKCPCNLADRKKTPADAPYRIGLAYKSNYFCLFPDAGSKNDSDESDIFWCIRIDRGCFGEFGFGGNEQ